jgi:hypothetical protein
MPPGLSHVAILAAGLAASARLRTENGRIAAQQRNDVMGHKATFLVA